MGMRTYSGKKNHRFTGITEIYYRKQSYDQSEISGDMNSLFEAGLEIQEFFNTQGWPFCFIGGLAVLRWGEPRMTVDLDVCLLCGLGNESLYIKGLLEKFKSRIEDALDFAERNRILLIVSSNGIPIDISLSGLPFEEEMIDRATSFSYAPDCKLVTATAEDIIVLKAFADRPRDWADVENIIMRQGNTLHKRYIFNKLKPLCMLKEEPEIYQKLQSMLLE